MSRQRVEIRMEKFGDPTDYQDWLDRIVDKVARRLPAGSYDRRGLVSAAYVGLLEAMDRFDQSNGTPFKMFAFLRVRGAVLDQVRKDCFLSVKAGQYAKMRKAFKEAAHSLSEEERQKVVDRARDNALAYRTDFNDSWYGEQECQSAEELIDFNRAMDRIREGLAALPEEERTIITEYYFKDRTFDAIAADRKKTKSGVWKVHKRGLAELRKCIEPKAA